MIAGFGRTEATFAIIPMPALVFDTSVEAFTDSFYKPALLAFSTAGYRSVP